MCTEPCFPMCPPVGAEARSQRLRLGLPCGWQIAQTFETTSVAFPSVLARSWARRGVAGTQSCAMIGNVGVRNGDISHCAPPQSDCRHPSALGCCVAEDLDPDSHSHAQLHLRPILLTGRFVFHNPSRHLVPSLCLYPFQS